MYVECKCTVNKLDYICKPLCWQQRVCDCNKHCCSAFYFLVEWPSLLYNHKNLCDEYSNIIQIKVEEPPKRKAGIKVANVEELVQKLKNEAKVI